MNNKNREPIICICSFSNQKINSGVVAPKSEFIEKIAKGMCRAEMSYKDCSHCNLYKHDKDCKKYMKEEMTFWDDAERIINDILGEEK